MAKSIFVNLPVKDLKKSIEFFTRLGFSFNPQFTDETATCMIVSDDIFVMLLTEPKFQSFTPKPICDARRGTEVLIALSCESRSHVREMVQKAVAAGGSTYNDERDHGFMRPVPLTSRRVRCAYSPQRNRPCPSPCWL